ncbi:cytochrome c oxidase assembly protein [Neisseriaceae bacterium TC5R-5]|nr:cytochrome c oxidase assembly protein [Neisseriaceae bacterium TC5R-5]
MDDSTDQMLQNRQLLKKLSVIAVMMFGFAWALIPIYNVICEVTGINQIVKADQLSEGSESVALHMVSMTFDATVQAGLPWQVRPQQTHLQAKPGEFVQVQYTITNASNKTVVGQAIPRYLPAAAAQYVKKLECFCFRQQVFQPGETRTFPIVFVIDKSLPASIETITLAYSVFDVPGSDGGAS